jgi:uncharacterized protein (DUF427 family)
MTPVEPLVPGPGQESVWEYPRPPRAELSREHVLIRFDGHVICDTKRSIRVLETSHPPSYYLPIGDFERKVLVPAGAFSDCEWKGRANYFDIRYSTDGRVASRSAWGYAAPLPGFESLRGHVAVYAAAMDEVTVDGEPVEAQPGSFYGGWITSRVVGPFKGAAGSTDW